ncbi:MAG: P-loop NTPase [Bacteroidota bacterium]
MELAIISGKGGTGKSSISAALATLTEKIVLADCDVDAANQYLLFNPTHEKEQSFTGGQTAVINPEACTNCGICVPYCRFDAISFSRHGVVINETACDGCQLCRRICPHQAIDMINNNNSRLYAGSFRNGRMVYGRLAPGEENSGKLVNLVRDEAKVQARQHGLQTIIIDGPPGIGCPVISSITGTHQLLIVTEPSLSALLDLQRAVEMSANFHIQTFVIINKYDLEEELSQQIETWCRKAGIEMIGKVPFDPQVVQAMTNRKSITEWAPDSAAAQEIGKIWTTLKRMML